MTLDVLKEWWYYFFQCSECRRCSVFCPYGIDTAEITIMGRELLNLLGLNIDWIATPVSNCYRTGNHLGIQPHAFKDMLDFFVEDIEEITGIQVEAPFQQEGGRHPVHHPFGRRFRRSGHLHLHGLPDALSLPQREIRAGCHLEHLRLRGRQLRLFHLPRNHEAAQRQDVHGGQTPGGQVDPGRRVRPHVAGDQPVHGHHERPGRFLEVPVNPITGTVFENAASTKMVHIAEFTADLIKHGKLDLDPAATTT
jgi:hypothetical protein